MDLKIEARNFQVTEAIQTHLEDKLGKLERYFDGIHRMHAILSVEKKNKRQTVELVCTVAKRGTLVAIGEADDIYAAADKAEKKMLAEMKKYKAKLRPTVRGKKRTDEATPLATIEVAEEDLE
ncbi:MAG TPA: ribosome-associated translation inhibitor RaiA [Planctomycetota bacterium]|jgi:ribosomal subunit interface protein